MNNVRFIRLVYLSLGLGLFFSILTQQTCFSQKVKSEKPIIWKETIGVVDPNGYKHGTITFDVNGKAYTGVFKGVANSDVDSFRYIMRYNVNNPNEIQVDYWRPVFVEGEKTHYYTGRITKIQKPNFLSPSAAIIYSFKVGGRNIERWIYLPRDFEKIYPDINEGQYYSVEALDKNVLRSVLHLDKPIKDTTRMK